MADNKPAVAFYSLGCKLNQAELESLAYQFMNAGYQIVDAEANTADVYILNTCTVTHIADRKSRHMLRMWRSKDPGALIVATGCYAQRAPLEIGKMDVDIVVDNRQKPYLLDIIGEQLVRKNHGSHLKQLATVKNRIRSFIKIQDGCHHFCSYCIVPLVRSPEYSVPASVIINEINDRITAGYQEIVLTGTRIGTYTCDDIDLTKLIQLILTDTGVRRLHLSSLQPREISPDLLALWADKRLCRHFHLALQSGSSSVLKRMNRDYTVDGYEKAVLSIRKAIPSVAITTDIMVGFPGETDIEFEESYRFCRSMGFAAIHVFSYSPRPGTKAATLNSQVPAATKKERSLKMLALSRQCIRDFQSLFIGKELEVLWENETAPGSHVYSGLTDNYIRLFFHSAEPLSNSFHRVMPVKSYKQGLWVEDIE